MANSFEHWDQKGFTYTISMPSSSEFMVIVLTHIEPHCWIVETSTGSYRGMCSESGNPLGIKPITELYEEFFGINTITDTLKIESYLRY